MNKIRIIFVILLAIPTFLKAENQLLPHIPEPMVFDLVRGLDSKKGELEVNTLGLFKGFSTSEIEWAPEIEYAISDGFAVEFELPHENGELESYKFASQYTLGGNANFVHGLQGILVFDRESEDLTSTLLYLTAYRFNSRLSYLGMFGGAVGKDPFPTEDEPRSNGFDFLANVSLFYDYNDNLVFGLETNTALPVDSSESEFLIMPQAHLQLSDSWTLQSGIGKRFVGSKSETEIGMRLIKDFYI